MKKNNFIIALLCMIPMISCLSACSGTDGFPAVAMPHGESSDSDTQSAASKGDAQKTNSDKITPAPTEPVSAVEASWFDDAVFLGDSVTLKLSEYCMDNPEETLSDAKFFCAGSLGYNNALWDLDQEDAVHPYYEGENYQSKDCAAVTGAKKVFIMLGMNDIGLYGIDGAMEAAQTLISDIREASPGVDIYIQSVTPIMAGKEGEDLNNLYIRQFNGELEIFCEESGYKYLDIYDQLADEGGYLPLEYCSDPEAQGKHFTDTACDIWIQYLKENVQ